MFQGSWMWYMMTHSLYKQSTSLLYLFNKPKCMKVASAPKPLNIPFVRKRRIKLRPKRQANCKDQQISSTESCSRQYICQCIQFTSRHSNFNFISKIKRLLLCFGASNNKKNENRNFPLSRTATQQSEVEILISLSMSWHSLLTS